MFRRIATAPITAIRKAARPHEKTTSIFPLGETTAKRSPYLPEVPGQRIPNRMGRNVNEFAPALKLLRNADRMAVLGKFSDSICKQSPAHAPHDAHTPPRLSDPAAINTVALITTNPLLPGTARRLSAYACTKDLNAEHARDLKDFLSCIYDAVDRNSDANRTQCSKQWEIARILSSPSENFELFLALTEKTSMHGEVFGGDPHTVAVRKEAYRQELLAAQQLIHALDPADQQHITPAQLRTLAQAAHDGDMTAIAPAHQEAVNALAAQSLAVKAYLCAGELLATPAAPFADTAAQAAFQQNVNANIPSDLQIAYLFYRNGCRQEGDNTPLAEVQDRIFAVRHKWLPRGHANKWMAGFHNVVGCKKSPMHAIRATNSAADAERGHQQDGNPRLNWNLDKRDNFDEYVDKLIDGIDTIANQSKKGDTPEFTNGGTIGANLSVAGAMEFLTSLIFPGFSFSLAPDARATRSREAYFSAGSNNFRAHLNMGTSVKKTIGAGIGGSAGVAAPGSTALLGFFTGLSARMGGTVETVERSGVTLGHKLKKTGGMVYANGAAVEANNEWRESLKQMARVLLLSPDDRAAMMAALAAAYFAEPDFSAGEVKATAIDVSVSANVGIRAQFSGLMLRFGPQLVAGFSASIFNKNSRRESGARTGDSDAVGHAAQYEGSAGVTLGLPNIDTASLAGVSLYKVSQKYRGKGVSARLQNVEDEGGLETDCLYLEVAHKSVNDYIAYTLSNKDELLDTFDDGEAIRQTTKDVRKKLSAIRDELVTGQDAPLIRVKLARKKLKFQQQRIDKLKVAAEEFRANVREARAALASGSLTPDWDARLPTVAEANDLFAALHTATTDIEAAQQRCKTAKNEPATLQSLDDPAAPFFAEIDQCVTQIRHCKTAAAVFCDPLRRTSREVAACKLNLTRSPGRR